MIVDWGDGSTPTALSNALMVRKAASSGNKCSHTYNGSKGDEFIITLRPNGNSCNIPHLLFGGRQDVSSSDYHNQNTLVAVLENTLTCETEITLEGWLDSITPYAMQNNIGKWTKLPSMDTYPEGFLNHLTKEGHYLTSCKSMLAWYGAKTKLTLANMAELKQSIARVTDFGQMFYEFKGTCDIPDDFFDGITDGTITNLYSMVDSQDNGASCTVTGDKEALERVLNVKKTSNANTTMMLRGLKTRTS
jgi:hypothetical protein